MELDPRGLALAAQSADRPGARWRDPAVAEPAVTALYRDHALGLTRLAHVMLGDRQAAEDVVQEAFTGLYRDWDDLADPQRALAYVRSCVLNGSRSALRRRAVRRDRITYDPPASSAEAAVLTSEERTEVMRALRGLPLRQREILVLRFYPDGGSLAMIIEPLAGGVPTAAGSTLRVYSTATGAVRTWGPSVPDTSSASLGNAGSLAWAADGRHLCYIDDGVRLLDTAARGDNLLASSRLLVPQPKRSAKTELLMAQAEVTADGHSVLVVAVTFPVRGGLTGKPQRIEQFSAWTGRLEHVLVRSAINGDYASVAWASPSGQRLLVTALRPGQADGDGIFPITSLGTLSGTRYTPLPWLDDIIEAAW